MLIVGDGTQYALLPLVWVVVLAALETIRQTGIRFGPLSPIRIGFAQTRRGIIR